MVLKAVHIFFFFPGKLLNILGLCDVCVSLSVILLGCVRAARSLHSRKRLCDATTGILYIITRSTCPNLSETVFRQPDGSAAAAAGRLLSDSGTWR